MSERHNLLLSVADTIKSYRNDELPEPTPDHVDRWLHQFTQDQQLPFLREFDHVMKQSFITQKNVETFLRNLVRNEKLAGGDPVSFWSAAHFLKVQQNGQSQKEMLKLFARCLADECGVNLASCGKENGDYIYLDDVLFSGSRVGNDLERWITEDAPQLAKVHVIVAAMYTSGSYFVGRRLKDVIAKSGKTITIMYWRSVELENRKTYKNRSSVLWPCSIPETAEVQTYMALPTKFPFEPRQASSAVYPFSSEAGRQVLESEFLIAGAKIRALSENPKQSIRPLGFSPFGLGFGSMLATYRNCPNNSPLAIWWGDPDVTSGALHWYPLLQREGYSSLRNIFDDLSEL
ncbi:hypothetical protein JOE33_004022 [Pseudomonas sp. PvP027]|uniref:phosphoribosyltransferase-like protein n=1 Tax=Pseudomonas TaxID=286 RepID=UPI001655AEEB|nr:MULTISPECIES: hypothetical protein [Pseudomonas]MBC8800129.1 hypothetical protein [Pseudomonas congelans]MBP1147099.1 hypothetical protein [Pseudomonas sp. PvP027]